MKHNLLLLASLLFICQVALCQNYQLDSTFGVGGKVINTDITSGQVIHMQSNGKIVSCFISPFSTSGNMHLTRFNSDGNIDTSFGVNGFVDSILFTEVGGWNMMKIQSDDKIIVTGNLNNNGSWNFATARFNANGTIDTTFGTNGYAVTDFGAINGESSTTVEIQNNGAILVGGYMSQNSLDVGIVRYFPNGTIDTTFGTNGKFMYNFGTTTIPSTSGMSSDQISAIRVNSAGKIIIGVSTNVNAVADNQSKFGFICLNSNGTLDTTFGSNGQKVVDFGGDDAIANIRLTSDDKIIATGRHDYKIGTTPYIKIAISKLLENGDFDINFGNNGIVLANRDDSNLYDFSNDLSIQSDGKIICFGFTPNITNTVASFLIIRFNADGTIDNTFNSIGYKTIDFNNNASPNTFLIQNDGKIVCAGSTNNFSVGCLARLEIDNLSTNNFSKESIFVYPNPFSDSITIDSKSINLQNSIVELYDISGRKLSNYQFTESKSFTIPINQNLSKGNYFLKVIAKDGKTETIKIIKH